MSIIQRETTVKVTTDTTAVPYAIIGFGLFLPQYANAETIGGVAATAAPVANSPKPSNQSSYSGFTKVHISLTLTAEEFSVRRNS